MFKRIRLFLTVYIFLILSLIFVRFTLAGEPNELMAQGRIKMCLKADWNSYSEEKGSKRTQTIRLQGQCLSPAGCTCVKYQHPNGAVAADQEGGLDAAFCGETAYSGSSLDNVLGATSLLAKKTDPEEKVSRKSMAKTDAEKRAIDLGNRCRKAIREANDPVLGAVPTGPGVCNIIKNNLIAKSSSNAYSDVLGVNDSGLIPYGPVDIIVQEETYKHSPIEFSAVGDLVPEITQEELGAGEEITKVNDKTQKLGTFQFVSEALNVSVEDIASNCTAISWDPYGRIFDAESLEPIAEVEVELLDGETKEPVEMSFNLPYDFTGHDGLYNIQVEKEGKYSITVEPITNHQFVSVPKLNPLWNKIYSDIYLPNNVFYEKQGFGTHHDIPLQSTGKPYRGAVSVVVPGTLKSEQMNNGVIFSGRVTFPMAKVCLIDESNKKLIGSCVNANNIGRFTIVVDKTELPQNKILIVTEKVDLTKPELYKKEQTLETLNIHSSPFMKVNNEYYYEPILSLVKGYAYNEKGEIIPNAKIQVKLKINKSIFYETRADSNGFFNILSNKLPSFEYYLEIFDPVSGKNIKKSTSQFIVENKLYLDKEKIDLVTGRKKSNITNPADLSSKAEIFSSNKGNNFNIMLAITILIILLLLIIASGIILYIKKSKTY